MTPPVEPRRVGMITPPGWFSYCGDELTRFSRGQISVMNTVMRFDPPFGYTLPEVSASPDELRRCVDSLGNADSELIVQVGTPFSTVHGWQQGCALEQELSERTGVRVEMMGLSVVRKLQELGVTRVAATTVYYDAPWTDHYAKFLASADFDVAYVGSFEQQGIAESIGSVAACTQHQSVATIERSVQRVIELAPAAEAIVIAGIPCQLLDASAGLSQSNERHVVTYTAMYERCARILALPVA